MTYHEIKTLEIDRFFEPLDNLVAIFRRPNSNLFDWTICNHELVVTQSLCKVFFIILIIKLSIHTDMVEIWYRERI